MASLSFFFSEEKEKGRPPIRLYMSSSVLFSEGKGELMKDRHIPLIRMCPWAV
jgi:hypothetical protein